jgi:hypothetical protein
MRTAYPLVSFVLAVVACIGCMAPAHIRDTKSNQSPDATRAWFVEHTPDGTDKIIYCDAEMLKSAHQLCVAWPHQGAPAAPPSKSSASD